MSENNSQIDRLCKRINNNANNVTSCSRNNFEFSRPSKISLKPDELISHALLD